MIEIIFQKIMILVCISILFVLFMHKTQLFKIIKVVCKRNKNMIVSIILFSLILGLHIFLLFLYSKKRLFLMIAFDVFSIIFYLNMFLLNIKNQFQLAFEEEKIENLLAHNKTLDLCTINIKKFENDFNNIMQDFGGYIKYNDFESLKSYYYKIMEEYKEIKTLSVLSPVIINESAIYNIISNKYYLAKSYGIDVEMEFMMDFSKLDIKTYELARILGILLDNAIEATKSCKKKKINMVFQSGKSEDRIRISNTYKEDGLEISKIFEKGFSTKEKSRGLGLWEIKQILQNNSNLELYTYRKNSLFWQELSIFHFSSK